METDRQDMIRKLLDQAPEGVSATDVETILEKNLGNVVDTLSELWELPVKNISLPSDSHKKWQEVRDICSAYEQEMQNFMNDSKRSNEENKVI
jgi:hypothetical protein